MRTCTLCHADNVETVPLWNGKHYCARCLDKEHEGLYAYARVHTTLTSNDRQFFDWAFFRYVLRTQIPGMFLGFCLFVGVASLATLSGDPPISLYATIVLASVLFTFVLLVNLGNPYFVFLREIQQHPCIDIADGKITLSIRVLLLAMPIKTKTISLPLSSVKLRLLPLSKDIYLPMISIPNKKQYALLDFSSCIEESFLNVMGQIYFPLKPMGIEKKRWSENPYLCFSASPVENDILEAFFRIAELETGKMTEPQS